MTSNYDEIPDWIRTVTPEVRYDDAPLHVNEINRLITELNFLKGSYVGHSAKLDDLEEKLKLAFNYQTEIDARLVEKYRTDRTRNYEEIITLGGETMTLETDCREKYCTPNGLAEAIRKGE